MPTLWTDAAIARLLTAAAPRASCDLHLALLTVWECGSAEYTGYDNWHYHRGRRDAGEDEDEFEVIDVHDFSRTLSQWRRPYGSPTTLGILPIEDEELSPADALDGMEPDEEHFHEATGNEGASFDRTYARAALVIWPSTRILAVLNQAGLEATLPYVDELLGKWQAAGPKNGLALKQQSVELAGHMIASWPERSWRERDRAEPSKLRRMFSLLARLGDLALVEAMIGKLVAQQGHDNADNPAILEAVALFASERSAETLQKIVASNAVDALGSCGALLATASKGPFATEPVRLFGAAQTLVEHLPGDPASAPKDQWGRSRGLKLDATFVADMAGVLDRVDAGLASRTAAHILAWPRHFGMDRILVPAVKLLLQRQHQSGTAFDALRTACITHLDTRIAQPLEAPQNWGRPSAIGCKCQHCTGLSEFLADPVRDTWTLRAAQQVRSHVENEINRASADVDMQTLRKGSPHSLICTKNQASYQRRVTQRKQDLADLTALHCGAIQSGSKTRR